MSKECLVTMDITLMELYKRSVAYNKEYRTNGICCGGISCSECPINVKYKENEVGYENIGCGMKTNELYMFIKEMNVSKLED